MSSDDPVELFCVIGSKTDLRQESAFNAARGAKLMATRYPDIPITLSIAGYDDDPRELHEISEVRYYVILFAAELHSLGLPPNFAERLTPESLKWGLVAGPRDKPA